MEIKTEMAIKKVLLQWATEDDYYASVNDVVEEIKRIEALPAYKIGSEVIRLPTKMFH